MRKSPVVTRTFKSVTSQINSLFTIHTLVGNYQVITLIVRNRFTGSSEVLVLLTQVFSILKWILYKDHMRLVVA